MALPIAALRRYERPLSAIAMVTGFGFDNYFFGRVDHPATQFVLFAYMVLAIATIVTVHFLESFEDELEGIWLRLHPLLVFATQFALGGLWSAFLVFYGRSAVIAASWPFLIVLAAMLVGNEVFRKYHSRLAFTCTLLFLALFSYAIFVVPVVTRSMGRRTFLLSGSLAVVAFVVILGVLSAIGPQRMRKAWRGIIGGALGVYACLNLFYFTNVLPPLPLALSNAGVFHGVDRSGPVWQGTAEPSAWYGSTWINPVLHVTRGEPLYLYSAVFAPIQLKTDIVHVWQRYDDAASAWHTEAKVTFPIMGGRDGGYRGISSKAAPRPGRWRVDIETPDGLVIGRVGFSVASVSTPVKSVMQVLP